MSLGTNALYNGICDAADANTMAGATCSGHEDADSLSAGRGSIAKRAEKGECRLDNHDSAKGET
jgi:hypothetical protein